MKPITITEQVPILTPDSLLINPCSPVRAGDTVRSLAKGYVENTGCIKKYQLLLKKQRQHKQQILELYDGNKQQPK